MTPNQLTPYLNQIHLPLPDSHKGQNGKVMIIGGSQLFHAASQWALLVTSRLVDMVFYASIPSNNDLIQEAKAHFANGIVIPRTEIENYIEEADVILIGPGMERSKTQPPTTLSAPTSGRQAGNHQPLTIEDWNSNTEKVVNYLLSKYPHKKWAIDAGALQMMDPTLLNERCIITPHQKEFESLMKKVDPHIDMENLANFTVKQLNNCTVLLKGVVDTVYAPTTKHQPPTTIPGGNQGMTKGGTGDVLAGLVAGLYCFTDSPESAAIIASTVNKQAGDELHTSVGPFFNATDLAHQIPKTLAKAFKLVEK